MQRVTITIDDELMTELDRIIATRGYQNRSEAIRDLARAGIREAAAGIERQARLRGRAGLHLRSRRPPVAQAPDRNVPRSSRAVAVVAARPPRPRQLHGGHGAAGQDRPGAALRRARDRRARRAARPRRDDAHGRAWGARTGRRGAGRDGAGTRTAPPTPEGTKRCRALAHIARDMRFCADDLTRRIRWNNSCAMA